MKRVTIQDIAEELHLSRNTVAKALSDGSVSYETKVQVVKKAHQMGYAKLDEKLLQDVENSLKQKNTGTILVLFDRMDSSFWKQMLTGISDAVTMLGYRMQLHIVEETDLDGDETMKVIAPDIQGIIFLCVFPIRFVKGMQRAGLPMTFFNIPVNAEEYIALGDVINVDGFYSLNRVTSYLIEKGKKDFAFIGYAQGSRVVQSRYIGFINALQKYHIPINEKLFFTKPQKGTYFNYGLVAEIIEGMEQVPEVFICENDDVAEDVATALMKRNYDLAMKTTIVGFDNTISKDFFKPDIITVDIRKENLGKRLVRSILDRVEDPAMDHAFITLSTYPILPD